MKIAAIECQKQNLDKPEVAYYQCGMICGAILHAADQLGITGIELMGARVKFPDHATYAEEDGKLCGHYFLKVDSTIYDFTLRQFLPDSPYPFVTELDSIEAKNIYRDLHSSIHEEEVYGSAKESHSNSQLIEAIVEQFRMSK